MHGGGAERRRAWPEAMKVSDAIAETGMGDYYRRKFADIVARSGLADLDLEKDWQLIRRQLRQTLSFNLASIFGSIWGAYRQAPYWQAAISLNVLSVALAIILKPPQWLTISINVFPAMYMWHGNSLLLVKYLRSRIRLSSLALVEEEMQPNGWAAALAAAVVVVLVGTAIGVDLSKRVNDGGLIASGTVENSDEADNASVSEGLGQTDSGPEEDDPPIENAPDSLESQTSERGASPLDSSAEAAMDAAANALDAAAAAADQQNAM